MDTVSEFSWAGGERWIELRYGLLWKSDTVRFVVVELIERFR